MTPRNIYGASGQCLVPFIKTQASMLIIPERRQCRLPGNNLIAFLRVMDTMITYV